MFLVRWRWPILALLLAGISYLSQYYTIGGIEHLHLQPRERGAGESQSSAFSLSEPGFGSWSDADFGLSGGSRSPAPVDMGVRPEELRAGEKRAMWQERASAGRFPLGAAQPSPVDRRVPYADPIPLPADGAFAPWLFSEQALDGPRLNQALASPMQGSEQAPGYAPSHTSREPGRLSTVPSVSTDDHLQTRRRGSSSEYIRIASFNAGRLSPDKLQKPAIMEAFLRILIQYDVTALQEIETTRDDLLPLLVDRMNQSGRRFDYLIGPRVGSQVKRQFAFVFDTERLETDHSQLYTIADPQDLISYEPLVAWFRCKDAPPQTAFTFSLVNFQLDSQRVLRECELLPQLIQAIQNDGRGEDDWILVGDIAGSTSTLIRHLDRSVRSALPAEPTDVLGTQVCDAILFPEPATVEYTGRTGTFDFLREYNLSMEQAMAVSRHLPIWAEFSTVEGSTPAVRP